MLQNAIQIISMIKRFSINILLLYPRNVKTTKNKNKNRNAKTIREGNYENLRSSLIYYYYVGTFMWETFEWKQVFNEKKIVCSSGLRSEIFSWRTMSIARSEWSERQWLRIIPIAKDDFVVYPHQLKWAGDNVKERLHSLCIKEEFVWSLNNI